MRRKLTLIIFAVLTAFIVTGRKTQTIDDEQWFFNHDEPPVTTENNSTAPVTTLPELVSLPDVTFTQDKENSEDSGDPENAEDSQVPENNDTPEQVGNPPITTSPDFALPDISEEDGYDNEWAFYLINGENPLPHDFSFNTRIIFGEYRMDERAADYAIQMLEDARRDGVGLVIVSAYRTAERQRNNYNAQVQRYIDAGYSENEAHLRTGQEIAPPGASEHNAGLALDILDMSYNLSETFDRTREFEWLIQNSYKYGFILRYPKNKIHVTGIIYEPWHFRFVGVKRATEITEAKLTLEEYIWELLLDGEADEEAEEQEIEEIEENEENEEGFADANPYFSGFSVLPITKVITAPRTNAQIPNMSVGLNASSDGKIA